MNKLTISRFPPLDYACNEAINTLCANLSYCGEDIQSVLITSRYEQEGKSSVAMNVMRTMASFGKRVVLVDADLRRSTLARRYRFQYAVQKPMGLAQYLAGLSSLNDVLYETDLKNAYIIPAGREVISSMQLLTSPRYAKMMEALRRDFDLILVDSPPAGLIVDAVGVARHSDGALVIVSCNRGRKQEIAEVVQSISQTGCRVLGAVLINVDLSAFSNRKYYYRSERYSGYYRNGYDVEEEKKPSSSKDLDEDRKRAGRK